MIEISREHLIALREVPRRIPPRCSGRRVHISAVYRWVSRGVQGVVLDAVKIGGSTFTSEEALQRFAQALTLAVRPARVTNNTYRERQSELADTAKRLADLLAPNRSSGNKTLNADVAANANLTVPAKR